MAWFARNTNLVKDSMKKEWTDGFYSIEGNPELTKDYAIDFDKESKLLHLESELPLATFSFTQSNKFMQDIASKSLIETSIERIFQSAKNDEARIKTYGVSSWNAPFGLAQGAVNIIKPTDSDIKILFVVLVTSYIIVVGHSLPTQVAVNGMRLAMERNGWTQEEISSIL